MSAGPVHQPSSSTYLEQILRLLPLKNILWWWGRRVNWAAIAKPWKAAGYGYILLRVAISFSGLQRSLAWKSSPLCIWVLLNEMQCKRQSITLELEALPPFQDWFLFHKLLLHGLMISLHANALGCYPGALTFHRTKNSSSSMLLWPKHFSLRCWILNTRASLPCCYRQERSWMQKSGACVRTCHLLQVFPSPLDNYRLLMLEGRLVAPN